MNNQEIITRLNAHLKEVNEMLALGDMGLLKSEEMYATKYRIEDDIKSLAPNFDKIEALKIEKAISSWRSPSKTGMFLNAAQVNPEIGGLHILIQELINAKGGPQQVTPVPVPELKITGSTINQAIEDAKTLLSVQGATSALDRVHTVLHGYLKNVAKEAGIIFPEDATLNQLLKELKNKHPALTTTDENIDHILKSMANILDKLNPLRNNASLAHPNPVLLNPDEAMLVINIVNTLLGYLDGKFTKKS